MGLLYLGTPLDWDDAMKHAAHVRDHGVTQFLHVWDRLKNRQGDELLWGDEVRRRASILPCPDVQQIEYMVISFDQETKNAKLSLRQTEILAQLSNTASDIYADLPDK